MNSRELMRLYFVMGSTNCVQDPVQTLEQAIQGGVTLFQFREKGQGSLQGDARVGLARELKKVCVKYGVPFIVNDDLELAIDVDADGIHVGQEDVSIDIVREKIGNKMVGVSCHTIDEAKIAVNKGADYIGVGPMYPTQTKLDTRAVTGPNMISEMRLANITIPIVGIGGITVENARQVLRAGADGVAVISAISQQAKPKVAAAKLIGTG
jgi:thiamine-phosphate pyrophosphorylase